MRMVYGAAVTALVVGLSLSGPALGQGLPSDVEEKLGLRKNASPAEVQRALSDLERSGRRLPRETEHKLRAWLGRQGSDDRYEGRHGRPFRTDPGWAGPPRGYYQEYGGDHRARCERRAERRGLRGYEFRDFMRWCLERG
jgi:hypothetical protein